MGLNYIRLENIVLELHFVLTHLQCADRVLGVKPEQKLHSCLCRAHYRITLQTYVSHTKPLTVQPTSIFVQKRHALLYHSPSKFYETQTLCTVLIITIIPFIQ